MSNNFFAFTGRMENQITWLRKFFLRNGLLDSMWQKLKFLTAKDLDNTFVSDSLAFFSQNEDRINRVISWLADEESKETYHKMIQFRSKGKRAGFIRYQGGDNQYFINDFFKYVKNEVLIDCGAYTGDTIAKFVSLHPEYEKILAFEPDPENFSILHATHGANPQIMLFNAGAFDSNGNMQFSAQGTSGSEIINQASVGNLSIQVRTIDSLGLAHVSFIKMDIEGAELPALQGARGTILRDKPKLAICIYHSNEDMIRIAEYIHNLVPEYKLWVRQHHPFQIRETVLYAQMEH
jgi:FkbM family methyltransferase